MSHRRTAARARALLSGLALLAVAAAADGCSRMVIGRLPANADADAGFDAHADAAVVADAVDDVDAGPDVTRDGARDVGGDVAADVAADTGAPADARDADARDADARDAEVADATEAGGAPPDAPVDGVVPGDADGAVADGAVDARPDAADVPPAIGVIAGRITMSDDASTVRGAGVAGVRVSLTGPSVRSAITDANGAYQFPSVAPGTYALALAKDGATFTPATAGGVVVGADSAGTVVSFTCVPPCGTGPAIDPARELFIQDPLVLGDARAMNAVDGAWSFRYLIEQMATTSPNLYVDSWINNIVASGRDMSRLRLQWPTVIENGAVVPDITRAPFQLLAIVNGIDAHATGQGELRFVFGIYDGVLGAPQFNPQGRTFTLMLTYALPATTALPNRQAWASRFHALGAIPFGDSYNAALQAITDLVTRTGVLSSSAENPKGSALVTLSINEDFGNPPPFQLRQLRPLPDPLRGQRELVMSAVDQSPDATLNLMAGALPDFLNANAALVQAGVAVIPAALLGMQSPAANPPVPWSFPTLASEPLRHAFAGQTCAGCHSSEVPAGGFTIFHVIPFNGPSDGSKSGWVTMVEIPRRVSFLQNQLTCSGASCALGAEPMMGPAR